MITSCLATLDFNSPTVFCNSAPELRISNRLMPKSAIRQTNSNKSNVIAGSLFCCVHIADIGAVIDVRFATGVHSNTDIATASDHVAGMTTYGRVVASSYISAECNTADGGITDARCIVLEGLITYRRIEGAGRVVGERNTTHGRVAVAVNITEERLMTDSGVGEAGGVIFKGSRSHGCVPGAGGVEQKRSGADGRVFDSIARNLVSNVENKRPRAESGIEGAISIAEKRIPTNGCVRHASGDVKKGMVPVRSVKPG